MVKIHYPLISAKQYVPEVHRTWSVEVDSGRSLNDF